MKVESKLISSEGLRSLYHVVIDAEEINQPVKEKLVSLQKKVKIKGFRAGKVPMETIHKMYADDSVREVANDLIQKTSAKIISDQNRQAALSPEVSEVKFDPQGNLEYRVAIELMPEIEKIDLSKLSIKQVKTEVTEQAIDQEVALLIKKVPMYVPLAQARPAKKGDLLEIGLQVFYNKQLKQDQKSLELLLGNERLPKEVEAALVGKQTDDTVEVTIKIPPRKKTPAGTSTFVVTIHLIKEKQAQKDLASLLTTLQLESEEKLRELIKNQLTGKYRSIAEENDHRQFLAFLEAAPKVMLPEKLIKAEIENLLSQLKIKQSAKTENAYRAIAEKRVKLGILVANIANHEKVEIANEEAKAFLQREAMNYGDQASEFIELISKDSFMRNRALAPLIEQKVFELAKECATKELKEVSEEEILALQAKLESDLNKSFEAEVSSSEELAPEKD